LFKTGWLDVHHKGGDLDLRLSLFWAGDHSVPIW
jgi:hypothetical protein